MISFAIFYCAFSYLFTIGSMSVRKDIPWWHIPLSPLFLPIVLGAGFNTLVNK